MRGIYNYVPETNHVSRVCGVATFLYSQFVLHVIFFSPVKYVYYYRANSFLYMASLKRLPIKARVSLCWFIL